ncbi:MAG: rRNA maturation RNase YbeY [Candidatus Tantalella remota]|nr:rRNA maturation RNase YbeY [Candidatus Tantalella remota]
MTITVNSENLNKKRRIDLSKVGKVAAEVFKVLKKKDGEVNIVFFSSQKMRALNRRYTGRDNSTDVLAFSPEKNKSRFDGDIAICTDKAASNARVYGATFTEETVLYVIHGILHLDGYDDTSEKTRKVMRAKEEGLAKKVRKFL